MAERFGAKCFLVFNLESLTGKHQKFNGNLGNWIEYMNDRNISARHAVNRVIQNDWYSVSNEWGGRWRLLYSLAGYAEPWEQLSWSDIRTEFPDSQNPFEDYIKHLCRCYEGEVALAWNVWRWLPHL